MAKRKPNGAEVPDGFVRLVEPDLYYWQKEPESEEVNPCQGIIMLRQPRHDWDPDDDATHRYQYVIRLTKPCVAVTKASDGNEMTEVLRDPGETIVVDETVQLEKIRGFYTAATKAQKSLEVIITPSGKRKIGGGRSVWRLTVDAQVLDIKPVPMLDAAPPKQLSETADQGDDDIPF